MAASADGVEALHRLISTDPPLYLSPLPVLSQAARLASQHLFSSLKPFTPKCPFDRLLVDGFDSEQIWQQIDLQTPPLITSIRREVKKLENNPEQISTFFGDVGVEKKELVEREGREEERGTENGAEDDDEEGFDDAEEEEEEEEEEDEEERESDDDEIAVEEVKNQDGDRGGVEDKFLKIKELEEYLEEDEAREYGSSKNKKGGKKHAEGEKDFEEAGDDVDDAEDEEEEEEEEDELGVLGLNDHDDGESGEELENARYKDFFGPGKKSGQSRKRKPADTVDDSDVDDDIKFGNQVLQKNEIRSTHEKELEKQRANIAEMERTNLEPKTWTMQGEVTAAKRPKNSALEVDLDFEHNVRPAPVITEEVTQSLEELIRKRIAEGHFDDVQKPPSLPSKAPREVKELDENKSKKGLGEIYADEYVQKTGLVSAALSFSDEQKKEASILFKKLCLKLDALSHFHFAPKPDIEDMSIQTNVPALAMEEIAPLAVSDAAMLAPEEVFTGRRDIKEEAELTQADRKRRRANKKRKFKAEKASKMEKKARENSLHSHYDKEEL